MSNVLTSGAVMPVYQQNLDIAWREVDHEAVLVDPVARMLRVLNPAGTFLWSAMAAPSTLEELAGQLSREFGIDTETARKDVDAFLRVLLERKLVREVTP